MNTSSNIRIRSDGHRLGRDNTDNTAGVASRRSHQSPKSDSKTDRERRLAAAERRVQPVKSSQDTNIEAKGDE